MAENQRSETWRAFAKDRIAHYQEQRQKALDAIEPIERGNQEFFESQGDEEMRNVTAERLAKERELVARMDELIRLYEADLA